MKLCKRMGLPKERAVSVPAVNGVARTSVPANTISLLMERLGGTVVHKRSLAAARDIIRGVVQQSTAIPTGQVRRTDGEGAEGPVHCGHLEPDQEARVVSASR